MKKFALRLAWLIPAACLFLLVLGARWGIAGRYGMALPDWDQWDAEALHLLLPWYQGHFSWSELAYPQNEHRVVVSKLINLGLTVANGQWDQRVEVAVNSALPALIAAGLFAWGRRLLRPGWHALLFCLLAALYGLPLAWENIVNGFHSAQHLLVGLSFAAIALLPFSGPRSARWWAGLLCLILALGTLASGFFAALIVAGLALLRWRAGEATGRQISPTLAVCGFAVAAGCLTRVVVANHADRMAQSLADFGMTIVRALGWPAFEWGWSWAGLLLWLPWFWLAISVLGGRRTRAQPAATGGLALLGLGGWVILQVLATGYARGAGGAPPASRYVDTLASGLAINALCLAWLGRPPLPGRRIAFAAAGWAVLFASGATAQLNEIWRRELPPARVEFDYCEQNVRNFIATGDGAFLGHAEIPYPNATVLLQRLQIPEIQRILPATVRAPLSLTAAPGAGRWVADDTRHLQDAPPAPAGRPSGLGPRTPPFDQGITWGSYGTPANGIPWRSEPLRTTLRGWLRFAVAGDAGQGGSRLELREPATGRLLAEVRPDRPAGDGWRSAYVRSPPGPFVVVAAESDPGHWMAFSQPVELGLWSYWAWRAMHQGFLLAEIAAAVGLASFGAAALIRKDRPAAAP